MEQRFANKPPWQIRKGAAAAVAVAGTSLSFSYGKWKAEECPQLLAAKEKIAPLEVSRRWELIKKMVNPYEIVYTQEDPHFHPSLSLLKPLSRSYFKLVEILYAMEFFEKMAKTKVKLRTAHIAEGPGGFIQAVFDVAERYNKSVQISTAMTLKATDARVPGWKKAAFFLQQHKEVRLHYGADGTGNAYILENQDSFIGLTKPGVDLFTADGGFDFSINYAEQEEKVFHLLCSSASIGLQSLSTEGCIVLKLFDTFAEPTQILILLLARCFREWCLYKPCMSRPCNSERYFLGRGYRGVPKEILQTIKTIELYSQEGLYPSGLLEFATPEELEYLNKDKEQSIRSQLAALEKAMEYRDNPIDWYEYQLPLDFQTSLNWCNKYRIPTNQKHPKKIDPPDWRK